VLGRNYIAGDFIYSVGNIRYSEWKKTFAIIPKKTVNKKTVWMRTLYKRKRWMHVEPPQFPVNSFNRVEFATWDEILRYELTGSWQ
jgi:hypothetical protein